MKSNPTLKGIFPRFGRSAKKTLGENNAKLWPHNDNWNSVNQCAPVLTETAVAHWTYSNKSSLWNLVIIKDKLLFQNPSLPIPPHPARSPHYHHHPLPPQPLTCQPPTTITLYYHHLPPLSSTTTTILSRPSHPHQPHHPLSLHPHHLSHLHIGNVYMSIVRVLIGYALQWKFRILDPNWFDHHPLPSHPHHPLPSSPLLCQPSTTPSLTTTQTPLPTNILLPAPPSLTPPRPCCTPYHYPVTHELRSRGTFFELTMDLGVSWHRSRIRPVWWRRICRPRPSNEPGTWRESCP